MSEILHLFDVEPEAADCSLVIYDNLRKQAPIRFGKNLIFLAITGYANSPASKKEPSIKANTLFLELNEPEYAQSSLIDRTYLFDRMGEHGKYYPASRDLFIQFTNGKF